MTCGELSVTRLEGDQRSFTLERSDRDDHRDATSLQALLQPLYTELGMPWFKRLNDVYTFRPKPSIHSLSNALDCVAALDGIYNHLRIRSPMSGQSVNNVKWP